MRWFKGRDGKVYTEGEWFGIWQSVVGFGYPKSWFKQWLKRLTECDATGAPVPVPEVHNGLWVIYDGNLVFEDTLNGGFWVAAYRDGLLCLIPSGDKCDDARQIGLRISGGLIDLESIHALGWFYEEGKWVWREPKVAEVVHHITYPHHDRPYPDEALVERLAKLLHSCYFDLSMGQVRNLVNTVLAELRRLGWISPADLDLSVKLSDANQGIHRFSDSELKALKREVANEVLNLQSSGSFTDQIFKALELE